MDKLRTRKVSALSLTAKTTYIGKGDYNFWFSDDARDWIGCGYNNKQRRKYRHKKKNERKQQRKQ